MTQQRNAAVRLTVISAVPSQPRVDGYPSETLWVDGEKIVPRPDISILQLKTDLLNVTNWESGYEFLRRYGKLSSSEKHGRSVISIEDIIGLARTVALAEKLLALKPKEFVKADKYMIKHELEAKVFSLDWKALKLPEPCREKRESAKLNELIALYGIDDGYDKYIEYKKTLSPADQALEDHLCSHTRDGDNYLIYSPGPDQISHFHPLLQMSERKTKNDATLKDYFVIEATTKKKALMLALANIIDRMGASLIQKIEVDSNGHFFQTYEATDWWSSIALHFRGRLLGSIMRPCLDCGKELINTNPDISPKNTRKYCDDTCSKRYRRRKKAQEA